MFKRRNMAWASALKSISLAIETKKFTEFSVNFYYIEYIFHDYISAISPVLARFSNSIFPKRNVKPALIERLFRTLFVLDDM